MLQARCNFVDVSEGGGHHNSVKTEMVWLQQNRAGQEATCGRVCSIRLCRLNATTSIKFGHTKQNKMETADKGELIK